MIKKMSFWKPYSEASVSQIAGLVPLSKQQELLSLLQPEGEYLQGWARHCAQVMQDFPKARDMRLEYCFLFDGKDMIRFIWRVRQVSGIDVSIITGSSGSVNKILHGVGYVDEDGHIKFEEEKISIKRRHCGNLHIVTVDVSPFAIGHVKQLRSNGWSRYK